MKKYFCGVFITLSSVFALAAGVQAQTEFGFNSPNIAGFGLGAAELTGGGAFNLANGFIHSGGGFRCTTSVRQGPLTGCLAGQGVRWDTATLLPFAQFKCTASEQLQTATTSANTVALVADFYRQGDGNEESFTAKMIVSAADLPGNPGVNVWIQGVGCGSAIVNFSRSH